MAIKTDMCPEPDAEFECGNGHPLQGRQLNQIEDFFARVSIGEEIPGGQCPICGALAHLVTGGCSKSSLHPEAQELYAEGLHCEHHLLSREEWRQDVGSGNTQLGYWEWLSHNLESRDADAEGPRAHLFSPSTDTCLRCGKTAEDDRVENTPCEGPFDAYP